MDEQLMPREMEVCLITGHKMRVLPSELVKMAVHRSSVAALAILVAMLLVFNVHARVSDAPVWAKMATYFPSLLLWNFLFVFAIIVQARLGALFFHKRKAFASVGVFIGAVGGTLAGNLILDYIGFPGFDMHGWLPATILLNYFIGEVVTIFMFMTIEPAVLREIRFGSSEDLILCPSQPKHSISPASQGTVETVHVVGNEKLAEVMPACLDINGVKICSRDIVKISSQDGYIDILTTERKYLEPFPIQEAISMIPEEFGYQVHRSHWISFQGISYIRKEGRNRIVGMSDGSEVPVARHRQSGFEKSLLRYADPLAPIESREAV